MTKITSALIVGGGIAGMSAAIMLRLSGIPVTLIDADPDWRIYGAGITITGATLRAFRPLGILDEVLAEGYAATNVIVCSVAGDPVGIIPTPEIAGPGVPGAGGIMRPALHAILSRRTRALGTTIRLGLSVEAITQRDGYAHVVFTDGTAADFDLVIGSDGIFSKVRSLLFPDARPPQFTGQSCWRLLLDRDPVIDRRHFFLGGPVKAGLNPVSKTEMYMFVLENTPEPVWHDEATMHLYLADLLKDYGGPLERVRNGLNAASKIVFRPLESILLPPPWYHGCVVLIGDAVHATTPQLASGAGMAIEDALVLVDEMERAETVDAGLAAFMARRFERCRMVVENSLLIGQMEVSGASPPDQAAIVERSLRILAEVI